MSDIAPVTESSGPPATSILAASGPAHPGEPPEALIRIAALVGGWTRKGARKRVRRVWPQLRADLDELYRIENEARWMEGYFEYLDQRKGPGGPEGAEDDIPF